MEDEAVAVTLAGPDPMVGSLLAERYRVLEVLGEGGAGRVYLARQEAIGRDVAIKVLRTDVDPEAHREFSSRFHREAALLGQLSHPNVVTVHDYGTTEDGRQFVVMERLRGRSLKDVLAEPIPPTRAAALAEGVARGLAHAHASGLVHRDIKPSNVFVVVDDNGRERSVILDFGLVKHEDGKDEVTKTGTYMGTPAYTAPEQARGDADVGGKADVYSLGVLLYRMIGGVLPYAGEHSMATVVAHITEPYPPLSARAPNVAVDADLESIVRAAMEKDPKARPDAAQVADRLEAWRERVKATGAPAPVRQRNPWIGLVGGLGAFGIVAIGGALLVVGLAAVGVGYLVLFPGETVVVAPPRTVTIVQPPPEPTPPAVVEPIVEKPPEPVVEKPKPVVEKPKPVVEKPKPPDDPPPPAAKIGNIVVDNVEMTPAQAERALNWVNTASEAELHAGKVYDDGVTVILANRPFKSMVAFGETKGIGEATVKRAIEATP